MANRKMHPESESRKALTAERLRELLHYDPETGAFTWRISLGTARAGEIAGCIDDLGYRRIGIDGRLYRAHRLAVLWMTGQWPSDEVDHRGCARADNRWDNLREASPIQNGRNTRLRSNNTSGYKGVSLFKATGRWQAGIKHAGRRRHLGFFDTAIEAHAAYCKAAKELDPEFARFS